MLHDCFQKTAKGREEIATRKYGLSLRMRSILLLIDGKKSGEELVQAYPGLGLTEDLLSDLEQQGFISLFAPCSESRPTPEDSVPSPQKDITPSFATDTCICTNAEVAVKVEESERVDGPESVDEPKRVEESERVEEPERVEDSLKSSTTLILNTIFPEEPPALNDELYDNGSLTGNDHLNHPPPNTLRDEHPTLFEAIKNCYMNGLRGMPDDVSAPLLESLNHAQTTRALAELRPAYLKALRRTRGKTVAAQLNEELELLLFACEE